METQTTVENPPSEPSTKSSLSDSEQALALKQIMLNKLGRLTGRESAEEIEATYDAFRVEQVNAKLIANEKRKSESAAMFSKAAAPPKPKTEWQEIQDAQREAERQRRRDEHCRLLLKKAACPDRHLMELWKIDEAENPKWAAVRDLLVDQAGYANGYLVALLGIRGTGKTELGVSVIDHCCQRMMTCRYIKAYDLFRDFRRAFTPTGRGERGTSEDDIVDVWAKYDLLVIDELHQRADTPYEQNTLINLIDLRYDAMKCTILIANQDKKQFAEAMTDSVVSRIYQTGEAIVCDWPSFRKPGSNWKQAEDSPTRRPSGYPPQMIHE